MSCILLTEEEYNEGIGIIEEILLMQEKKEDVLTKDDYKTIIKYIWNKIKGRH